MVFHGLILAFLLYFESAETEVIDIVRPPVVKAILVNENPQARNEERQQEQQRAEQQRQELAADLDQLGDATEEEFQELKMDLIAGFDNLGDALGDIRVPTDVDVETEPIDGN